MTIIFILIGISLIVGGSFLFLFLWAIKSGQYDDTDTPARRMLFDTDTTHDKPQSQL